MTADIHRCACRWLSKSNRYVVSVDATLRTCVFQRVNLADFMVPHVIVMFSTSGKASNTRRLAETDNVPCRFDGTPVMPPSSTAGSEFAARAEVDCPEAARRSKVTIAMPHMLVVIALLRDMLRMTPQV